MKVQIKVNEVDQEHLVSLFSTAFYGSDYLIGRLPDDETVERHDGECWEDIAARHILKGGHLDVDDTYADGDVYSELGRIDPEREGTTYRIGLEDIVRGLENAANGTFKEANDDEREAAREFFFELVENDGELDSVGAEYLMQIILFGGVIYG